MIVDKFGFSLKFHGWLSKLWSLFGYPKDKVPYYNRDPKRDHNFDNHPHVKRMEWDLGRGPAPFFSTAEYSDVNSLIAGRPGCLVLNPNPMPPKYS